MEAGLEADTNYVLYIVTHAQAQEETKIDGGRRTLPLSFYN